MSQTSRSIVPALLVACAVSGLAPVPARAAGEERRTFAAQALKVRNLIGEIRVEGHDRTDFEVEVRLGGKDASPETIRIEAREGSSAELEVVFPLGEQTRFIYPKLGRGRVGLDPDDNGGQGGWLSQLLNSFGRRRVEVAGSGRGFEAWADVIVRVPRRSRLELAHGVGDIRIAGVEAEVGVSSRSGAVDVSGLRGSLVVDTGSGAVEVRDVDGDLAVDTGSGSVELARCSGTKMTVDTGSGGVRGEALKAGSLSIDTGSGSVRMSDVGADSLTIDTGSGSVDLRLARMGRGDFEVDTGSGGIDLRLPADASAEIRAETGSGGIDLDLGEVDVKHQERDEVVLVVGAGGARIRLDTGSGGIRIGR